MTPLPMRAPQGVGAAVAADLPSSRRNVATANLAKPMDQMRSEAYGGTGFQGPLPSPRRPQAPAAMAQNTPGAARGFNDPVQNQLGTMTFKNLQPRRPAAGAPQTPGGGDTVQSYAGLAPYVDEQTGGSPRRLSGFRGRRAGARFTEGPSKGKTADQAMLANRESYAKLSPEEKARYEAKARMEDISSPVPAPPAAPTLPPPTPSSPSTMSIDGAELIPIQPGIQPKTPPDTAMFPKPRRKGAPYPGGRAYEDENY